MNPNRTLALAVPFLWTLTLATPVSAQLGRQQGLLEGNTATAAELTALPHFSAGLAADLVSKRPFSSMIQVDSFLSPSLNQEQRTAVYGKLFLHINLNNATREEMLLIPGLGPRMAHEFEEYRPYRSLAQFRKEIGKYVDEKEVARLEQFVFIPIDLNKATDEEIQSIPGLGPRMLHEFKEYRPYRNLEQFRKEIGKYVNEKEVARLERYVTIQATEAENR